MKIVFSFTSLKRGGFYTIFEADKELENISCQQFWEVVKKKMLICGHSLHNITLKNCVVVSTASAFIN